MKKYNFNHNDVLNFVEWVINKHNLSIGQYLANIKACEPFFLLAATGLGKTVIIPLYLLALQLKEHSLLEKEFSNWIDSLLSPAKIWVVVPKIPIAISEAEHLNELFFEYTGHSKFGLFGYRTSQDSKNIEAPIQFITTGILPLLAQNEELNPLSDRVVIDEAHVTLETDEGVEIAIAQLIQQKITVDYMSATVDTANLEQQLQTKVIRADQIRFKNYYHNLRKPLLESIESLILNTLILQNTSSSYYPSQDDIWFDGRDDLIKGITPINRASGMLIIVNSFESSKSDAETVKAKIEALCKEHGVEILMSAGKIERNSKLKHEFTDKFNRIMQAKKKFIIISTNIVEMGITWSELDYVVTMDSEYDNINIDGFQLPVLVPLGVNSLIQRAGRVGRKRPGCVYIAHDLGTDYADFTDKELNSGKLKNQAIRFPLAEYTPHKLAFLCATNNRFTDLQIAEYIFNLNLPSVQSEEGLLDLLYRTLPIVNQYVTQGISLKYMPKEASKNILHLPKEIQALKMSSRWVGTVQYPLILEALKMIVNGDVYARRHAIGIVIMSFFLDYPIEKFLYDKSTGENATTTDNGIVKNFEEPIINSDLAFLAYMIYDQFFFEISYEEFFPKYVDFTSRLGFYLNPTTVYRAGTNTSKFVKEFIEITEKAGYDYEYYVRNWGEYEPDDIYKGSYGYFDGYLDVGYEIADFYDQDSLYVAFVHRAVSKSYDQGVTTNDILLKFYQNYGVSFKLKSIEGKYTYACEVEYNGELVKFIVEQSEHFCQLDTINTFYGLIIPKVNKEGEIYISLEHLFCPN